MSHWNEKDTRIVDLPFSREECLGVWICLNCGLVTNNQPVCGYEGRCKCGSSSWDIVLEEEDGNTPSEIIEDRKNTVVVCSPPSPRHLEQFMDDKNNRFVYIDSQWTRIGGPKEEEPIPHVCTNCGLVITDAADPEDYVCPSCFCEGTLIKIEGLERLTAFSDHLTRQNGRLIEERDQYLLKRNEAFMKVEEWRDKYNDMKGRIVELANDPLAECMYVKHILEGIISKVEEKKGEEVE